MFAVLATKTMRYADKKPHLPQHTLEEGLTYHSRDTPIFILKEAVRIGLAEEIGVDDLEMPVENIEETPATALEEIEVKTNEENKDESMSLGKSRKKVKRRS